VKLKLLLVMSTLLLLVACTATVTTTISAVVTSAQITFPTIALQAQLDPATTATVNAWLAAEQVAIQETASIQSSSMTPAVQNAAIVAAFAVATEPVLKPGTPATVVAIVDTVATATAVFLSAYSVSSPAGRAFHAMIAFPSVTAPITFTIPAKDWRNLPSSMRKAKK
jgi:hypothetical protein